MDKYCIKCKYVKYDKTVPDLSKCLRKDERDLVSGLQKTVWCNIERMGTTGCSRDGIHYQPSRTPSHNDEPRIPAVQEFAPDGRLIA